jgi:uncharacterized protein (TIGR03067 family)
MLHRLHMSRPTLLGSAFLIAILCSPAFGEDDAVKKELKAMAGTWKPVSAENNGFKALEADLKDTRRSLSADGKWSMRRGDKIVLEWAVKTLDPAKKPKQIDIEVTSGEHKGVVYLAIYEIDGDTLRLCFAMPDRPVRPTEFSAGQGSARALSEFKRVKE